MKLKQAKSYAKTSKIIKTEFMQRSKGLMVCVIFFYLGINIHPPAVKLKARYPLNIYIYI